MMMISSESVIRAINKTSFNPAEREYIHYHAERIAETLKLLASLVGEQKTRLLDISPHILTSAIHQFLGDRMRISTLGWMNRRVVPVDALEEHVEWDLNNELPDNSFKNGAFDLILMGEVIEHLHTAPSIVLRGLRRCLKDGGLFVIQTPNAVAVTKRLAMLRGINPFEMIRENNRDPGHFREYTVTELKNLAAGVGLKVEVVKFMNYWKSPGVRGLVESVFPSLRNGLTVVFRS